jgi:hypothetical protein
MEDNWSILKISNSVLLLMVEFTRIGVTDPKELSSDSGDHKYYSANRTSREY